MAETFVKPSFAVGEVAPAFYGRVDIAKWHAACSVARNMVVSYLGGLFSRAGTALVGISKQAASASSLPPRPIEFRFSITQSYILEFGDRYMRVIANGAYVTEAALAITVITQANPCVVTIPGNGYVAGDDIFLGTVGGMTNLNSRTVRARAVAGNLVTIGDLFGNPINSLGFAAYTGGGTSARLYTLTTPYAIADLPYLKYTQSADVMSLTCVNQQTLTDYPPQDLTRHAANNWSIAPPTIGASIGPPTSCAVSGTAYATGPGPAGYGYVVTAVDAATGQESIPSNIGTVNNVVDIAGQFGTNTVTWVAPASGTVSQYNIYRATPDYTNGTTFTGQLFGYVGSTTGALSWKDTNVIADFTAPPPQHANPFGSTGNYPGTVAYFQQRRAYAATLNNPDTYYMSKPGAYTNFDTSIPTIDSDAITGTPWAVQVNAVQHMTPMPGGLIVCTGQDSWQVSGTSGPGSAITPAQQNAQQQESNGFSPILPPLKIDADLLFGQALGSAIRDYQYNYYFNIYAGTDTTILSNHMFFGHQILQWTWAREPYKVVWMIRDDGRALSFSFIKDQDIKGYARHDTNGLFVGVASAAEFPAGSNVGGVNAVYFCVKRYIAGERQWAYFFERMDSRLWLGDVEQVWAVDCALRLPQSTPAATLTASAAAPSNGCLAGPVIVGGANYSNAVQGIITDAGGTGSGAVVSAITVVGGAITGYTISPEGSGYSAPQIAFLDATGSGAIAQVLLDQAVTFSADAAVFSAGNVGSVIRMGGGVATITAFVSNQQVVADMVRAIAATAPNDPNSLPLPAAAGAWTMTAPVTTVTGLDHLEGMWVTGLADGNVIPLTQVVGGSITLPRATSAVTIGLPFLPQMQSLPAAIPGQEVQGKHKKTVAVTLRVVASRGIKAGQDQPVAAQQPFQAELPWGTSPYGALSPTNDRAYGLTNANAINAGLALPLFSGDIRIPISDTDWNTPDGQRSPGMVGLQQDYPLPMEVTLMVPEIVTGDTNG